MYTLANNLILKTRVAGGSILPEIAGLKAWYKFRTANYNVRTNAVTSWQDASANASVDMDIEPDASTQVDYNTTTGALSFTSGNSSVLETDNPSTNQLNLGAFTIFGVIDIVESGASNEAVLGRAGNDELRFYRGAAAAGFRARINGINRDIDLDSGLPTGKLLFTIIRAANGLITIRINGSAQTNTTSLDISNLFDFTRLGNGATDSLMYEIAIYNVEVSGSDLTAIENEITTRTGV